MLNSEFINQQAKIFAAMLRKQAGEKPVEQVKLCLWRVMQRAPTPKEIERGVKLIATLQKEHRLSAEDALSHFCTVALNLNEFLYLD
jgi:hypothetical protein